MMSVIGLRRLRRPDCNLMIRRPLDSGFGKAYNGFVGLQNRVEDLKFLDEQYMT